jgi:hypothetical protein
VYAKDITKRAYGFFSWKDENFVATTGNGESVLLFDLEKEWSIDAWMSLE